MITRTITNQSKAYQEATAKIDLETTNKVMYFAHNYFHNWILEVWSDDTRIANHLQDKWCGYNRSNDKGGTANFFKLYMNLSDDHRTTLIQWIKANYNYK